MLEFRLRALFLRKIVKSVKELVLNVRFECSPKEIHMRAIGSYYEAFVDLHLDFGALEHFFCDEECYLCLNMNHLATVLKVAGEDDSLNVIVEIGGDNVKLTFKNTGILKYFFFKKN